MYGMSENLAGAVRWIYNMVATFGRINFPGTNIHILTLIVGSWAIYYFYRWLLAQIFDVEVKK